jgi:methylthioribose-1-phosphate isomerase
MIDQRKIPNKVEWYHCRGYKDVIKGIETMVIRGAPAIGVAAPLSTIDLTLASGDLIPVEERSPREISHLGEKEIGPSGVRVANPAFDITPSKYVTAIITEKGIIKPPFKTEIKKVF